MPSKKSILLKSQGFTLVELLIVVAIIGVLASQGVPAYRRMIQKSRKGEAQIMLGNIATAESAFFSEYGSYGNHIARMGAMMEGTNFIYAAGVNVKDNCVVITTNYYPTATNVPALLSNPQYQTLLGSGNMIGRLAQVIAIPAVPPAPAIPAANGQSRCSATVEPTATDYVASATGFIRGGVADTLNGCDGALTKCDQWTITQNRVLVNIVDGIN